MDISQVRADLIAEQDALDEAMTDISVADWSMPTASPRWSVADQIAHLAYFDDAAAEAIRSPDHFASLVTELWVQAAKGETGMDEHTLGTYRTMDPPQLLRSWRAARATLATASQVLADDDRVPWYGPSMGSKSFLTARLMECWAHGPGHCRCAWPRSADD